MEIFYTFRISYSVAVFFMFPFLINASANLFYTDYLTSNGYKSTLQTITYSTGSSKVSCVLDCARRSWCMGANYAKSTRQCHLLDSHTSTTVANSDWVFLCCGCQGFRSVLRDVNPNLLGFWPLTAQFLGRDIGPVQNQASLFGVGFDTSPCWSQFSAMKFAGHRDSYVKINTYRSLELSSPYLTYIAYIKPYGDGPILAFNDTSSSAAKLGFHIWCAWGGLLIKIVDKVKGISAPYRTDTTNPLLDGQWNRVGISYDGITGTLYTMVNGNLDSKTDPTYVNALPSTDGDIYIGSRYHDGNLDDRNFNGSIACVKFYKIFIDLTTIDIEDPNCAYTTDWTV